MNLEREWENVKDKSLTVTRLCSPSLRTSKGSICFLYVALTCTGKKRFLFTSQGTSRNWHKWQARVNRMPLLTPTTNDSRQASYLLRGGAMWLLVWRSSRTRRQCCWSGWGGGWRRPGLDTDPTWKPAHSGSWQLMCGWCGMQPPRPS